jgi:CHAD domain-containing protein
MATETREIEWKYDAAPGASLPDLSDLPRVENQSDPDEQVLEATYYDTPNLDLAQAHITLRRRLGGDDAGWHLKLPEADGARAELQMPPDEGMPDEFAQLLTARLRRHPVQPVARISTVRQRRRLRDSDGALLAEVVLDRVTANAMIGEPAVVLRWSEVEVELGAHGDMRLLKAADRRLRDGGLHRSQSSSKLGAILADRMPAQADEPTLTRSSPAGQVVLAYLRAQVEQLLSCDTMVRRDLPDSVHQMRVASRRLRSALRSFRPLLREEQTEPLNGELRWLGEVLGEARDGEVLADHLTESLAAIPVELRMGPVQARITGHFAPQQAEARRALLVALGSERYLALLEALDHLITTPLLTPAAEKRADKVLPSLVWKAFRRTRRRMDAADGTEAGEPQNIALHEARKAAKRARYAAEVVAPAVGKDASRSAKALKRVQSTLGEHQDTVIARQALRELAIAANADNESEFAYGLMYAMAAEHAATMRKKGAKAWKRAAKRRRTAWMH